MTTEVINIQIREDGSRVVERRIKDIGGAAEGAAGPLDKLKGLLATVVTGAALAQLARLADEYTNVQNRLRLVTSGTENLSRVTKELLDISNATRSDFTSTAELYAKLASVTKELGYSQKDMLNFTKSLNQAIVLSGASAQEAEGGLRQLAQGLASGTLRGDELNSVLENFPKVADVIARGMGKTIGDIRKLGAEGKITADNIINAFKAASDELDRDFGTTVPTLSQSFTVLKNNFTVFIGQLNESTGVTKTISGLIIALANNLNTVIPILTGIGVAAAVAFAPGPIVAFANALKAMYAVAMANPWLALATVLAGVLTTLYLLRDELKLGIDDTTTLGDLARAAWESIGPAIQGVADLAASFFSWLTNSSAGTFGQLIDDIVGYEHENEATWLKILRIVTQVFDMIGAVVRGVMAGIQAVVATNIALMIQGFNNFGDAARAALAGDFSTVGEVFKRNAEMVAGAGSDAAENFKKAFDAELMKQQGNGLESVLDGWISRAEQIGKARLAAQTPEGQLNAGGTRTIKPVVDEAAAKKAAAALARLKRELESVLDQANPVDAAQRRLAESQTILTKAVKAGLITQQQATDAYSNLKIQLEDQLDPLGAVNRELDEHISMLKMSSQQAEIEQQLLQTTRQLRQDGLKLSKEEIDQLRAKLVVEQELNRIAQLRDQLEVNSQARKARDVVETVTTATGMIGQNGYTAGDAVNAASDAGVPGLSNTKAQLETQQEQWILYYETIDELRQQDLISETEAVQAKIAIFQQQYATQFQAASTALTQLSTLQKSENKKQAAIGKAAAIAQTIINTYQSATSAYAAMASIPYVGPFLGAAAAAAAVAAGMSNVQAIRSQTTGFRTGGNITVGGSGGTDSQLISLRATPGEKISVNTPSQARALERAGEMEKAPRSRTSVVNQTILVQGMMDKRTPEQMARAARREARRELERS